jgi:hypothetical protein
LRAHPRPRRLTRAAKVGKERGYAAAAQPEDREPAIASDEADGEHAGGRCPGAFWAVAAPVRGGLG